MIKLRLAEFRIRIRDPVTYEWMEWMRILPVIRLVGSDIEADKVALRLCEASRSDVRWNWQGNVQGHYISAEKINRRIGKENHDKSKWK